MRKRKRGSGSTEAEAALKSTASKTLLGRNLGSDILGFSFHSSFLLLPNFMNCPPASPLQLKATVAEMESRTSALSELKSAITANDDVYAKLINLKKEAENDVENLSDILKGASLS